MVLKRFCPEYSSHLNGGKKLVREVLPDHLAGFRLLGATIHAFFAGTIFRHRLVQYGRKGQESGGDSQ